VQIISVIPSKAYYEAAMTVGGNSWGKAGRLRHPAINNCSVHSTADDIDCSNTTVAAVKKLFSAVENKN